MTLPFYWTTTLKTNLSAAEIRARLGKNSALPPAPAQHPDLSDYQSLKLVDAASGERFPTVCFGRMEEVGAYRLLHVRLRVVRFILIFMSVWLFGVVFATGGILLDSLARRNLQDALITPVALSPFYLGFWGIEKVGFRNEAAKTLAFLRLLLRAHEPDE